MRFSYGGETLEASLRGASEPSPAVSGGDFFARLNGSEKRDLSGDGIDDDAPENGLQGLADGPDFMAEAETDKCLPGLRPEHEVVWRIEEGSFTRGRQEPRVL